MFFVLNKHIVVLKRYNTPISEREGSGTKGIFYKKILTGTRVDTLETAYSKSESSS